MTVDTWSCPVCERTYWIPAGWEPPIWANCLRGAQQYHALKHRQEEIDARENLPDPRPQQPGIDGRRICLCAHTAARHGPLRRACTAIGCRCQLFVARNS